MIKFKMKKILTVMLSVSLLLPSFSIMATAEDSTVNVVNVYNTTTFEQALGSENTDIILWQDIVYTGSTQVKCNSIDLNGRNLTCESLFSIQNGQKTLRILDSQYQKNNHTSTGKAIFKQGIDIGDSTLIFDSGVITVDGMSGTEGSSGTNRGDAGQSGGNGTSGIKGTGNVNFYDGVITIYGGNGGTGGNGARGKNGSASYYYDTSGWMRTDSGEIGGTGGCGGNGGHGIDVGTVSVFGGRIEVYGGSGGTGGRGGQGGNSYSCPGGASVSYTGEGGIGGTGGKGGYGASGIDALFVNVYNGTLICNGEGPGTAGRGGLGGYKGTGQYDGLTYQQAASGSRGAVTYGGGAGINASLTMEGGTVIAQGAEYASGIGGHGGVEIDGHNVIINGGFVSATGGQLAYDIGGGCSYDGFTAKYGEAGQLTVMGGTLELNTKDKATNVANPSFKNCTVTGEGADYYEGTYNQDGKFTVSGMIVKKEPETAIGDTPVKLVASFIVSRTSNITTPAPRGYVSFKENGKEIGTAVLEYSTHVDEGIRAIAEFEWIPTVENPEFIAEYIPSSGDAYASGGQASYGKLERIAVTKNPDKVLYIEDTNFVDTGMELTAYYSNNFSEIITSGWTTFYDFSEYGDKEVKISYGGKETMLPITVVEKSLTKIELTKNPNKMVYIEGTNFDDTGMELTLYYDNETSETITTGWTVEYDFSEIGMSTAIISYGEEKISLNIPVVAKSLDRIVVTKKPDKVEYAIGTSFIDKGMELTLCYDNETFETITSGWTEEYDFSEIGQKEVKISYAGKETTLAVNVVAVSLERIAVTKNPNKIVYVEGTQFVGTGMELTLYYNNDTSQKVTSGWTTEYDFSEIGQREVKISYAGKETTLIVSVAAKTLTQIEVVTTPNKLQYLEGEEFNTSGMTVKAYYDNNTSETITNYQVSGYTSTPGIKTITVNYRGQTTTFEVTVLAKQITSIAVTKNPTKMEYIEETEFESSGMELTLYFDNNTSEVIIRGWTVQYDFSQPGLQIVTVNYGGKYTTFTVTVTEKTISRIEVTNKPNKLQYLEGDDINTSGMTVTAYYDNNTSQTITDYQVDGYTSTPGTKMITISYNGKTATFTVVVAAKSLTSIEVTTKPNKLTYLEGDSFDKEGLVVTAYYNNNTSAVVTDYTVSGYDSTPGGKTIIVAHGGKTAAFTIEVVAKSLTSIAVTTKPTKTDFLEVKDELSVIGGKITLYYNNNTSQTMDILPFMVTGFDNTVVGTQTLTVSYSGFTDTYNIEIIAKTVVTISLTSQPFKTTYLLNKDKLSVEGGEITLSYNNDTIETIDLKENMVTGFDNSKLGEQVLTIQFGGKITTLKIIVIDVIIGDIDGTDGVTDADAEYLLMYTFFPEDYPVNQTCDYNGDGVVNDADAEHLLMYTFFPEDYPLS